MKPPHWQLKRQQQYWGGGGEVGVDRTGGEGNIGREMKQTQRGDRRDENIFPLHLVLYITFWCYVFSKVR